MWLRMRLDRLRLLLRSMLLLVLLRRLLTSLMWLLKVKLIIWSRLGSLAINWRRKSRLVVLLLVLNRRLLRRSIETMALVALGEGRGHGLKLLYWGMTLLLT